MIKVDEENKRWATPRTSLLYSIDINLPMQHKLLNWKDEVSYCSFSGSKNARKQKAFCRCVRQPNCRIYCACFFLRAIFCCVGSTCSHIAFIYNKHTLPREDTLILQGTFSQTSNNGFHSPQLYSPCTTRGTSINWLQEQDALCVFVFFVQRQIWIVDEESRQTQGGTKRVQKKDVCGFAPRALFVYLWHYVKCDAGITFAEMKFPHTESLVAAIATKQSKMCDTLLAQGIWITLIHVQTTDTPIRRLRPKHTHAHTHAHCWSLPLNRPLGFANSAD